VDHFPTRNASHLPQMQLDTASAVITDHRMAFGIGRSSATTGNAINLVSLLVNTMQHALGRWRPLPPYPRNGTCGDTAPARERR
jgi:hypothetical protein